MKKSITFLFIICISFAFGQIPQGYYNSATGTGLTLKTQLKQIIDNVNDGIPFEHLHVDQGYGSLWTLFTHAAFRDNDYENEDKI